MAFINRVRPCGTHKDILIAASHACHLMRNNLPHRENGIILSLNQDMINLYSYRIIHLAFAQLAKLPAGNFACGAQPLLPVMNQNPFLRNPGKHPFHLIRRHGAMSAKRRKKIHTDRRSQHSVKLSAYITRAGMVP